MKSVARRVVDRNVLRLIKMWLRATIEERDADGTRRMSGGKGNTRGKPQGGVASPLLANIYMNRFLKHWRLTRCNDTFHAHVVSYAADFVILSRGRAAEALAWMKAVMTKLGLTINEAKTSLRSARQERFDFLGYSFGAHWFEVNGKWYLAASPSKKSVQRLKTRVGDLLVPSNTDPWPDGKRGVGDRPQATAPILDSTGAVVERSSFNHLVSFAGNPRPSTLAEPGAVVISESTRRLLGSFCAVAACLLLA